MAGFLLILARSLPLLGQEHFWTCAQGGKSHSMIQFSWALDVGAVRQDTGTWELCHRGDLCVGGQSSDGTVQDGGASACAFVDLEPGLSRASRLSSSTVFFCFHSLSVEAFEQISYSVLKRSAPQQFTKLFFPFSKLTYIPFPNLVPLAYGFVFLNVFAIFLKLSYWYLYVSSVSRVCLEAISGKKVLLNIWERSECVWGSGFDGRVLV